MEGDDKLVKTSMIQTLKLHDHHSVVTDIVVEFLSVSVSAEFTESSYSFVVPENVAAYTPVSRVELIPSLRYSDFKFWIPSNLTHAPWAIFPDGSLYVTGSLDHEVTQEYLFDVAAVHIRDIRRKVTVAVRILVEDVNDNSPLFSQQTYHFKAPLNSCDNNIIGSVIALDGDSGLNGAIEYSFTGSGPGVDLVHIHPYTGLLSMSGCIFETSKEMVLQVMASDLGEPPRQGSAEVFINISPRTTFKLKVTSSVRFSISGHMTEGSVIGKVETNCGSSSYMLLKKGARPEFSIGSRSGEIILRRMLRKERSREEVLWIMARCEHYSSHVTFQAYMSFTGSNNHGTMFLEGSPRSIIVPEDTKVGSILARYATQDSDQGRRQRLNYTLSTSDHTVFKMDHKTGVLFLNRALDFEHKSRWYLNISVEDGGEPPLSRTMEVSLEVTNANDHRPVFEDTRTLQFVVLEGLHPGSIIGRVYAQDPDKNDILYVFAFVEPAQHPFMITRSTGIISYMGPSLTSKTYNLAVLAVDDKKRQWFAIKHVTISVNSKVQEGLKIFTYEGMMLQATLFTDESIGKVKARFRGDSQGQLFFNVVNSSLSSVKVNLYSGELYLQSMVPLDFNIINLTMTLSYESSMSGRIEQYFTTKLMLNHGNSYNLNFQKNDYMVNISEAKALRGARLVKLHALYPGNPLTNLEYLITDIYMGISSRRRLPRSYIVIDPLEGWLSVGDGDLDREEIEGSQVTVEVVVVDQGRNASRMAFTKVFINLLDVNDNRPFFKNETFIFHVPENISILHKYMVGKVEAEDQDLYSQLMYNWVKYHHPSFNLDPYSGIITTTSRTLDYEKEQYVSSVVQVSDGVFSSTANVLIIVEDINDNGPIFINDTYNVQCQENVPINTILGQVVANDADGPEMALTRYSLVSEWGSQLFAIHPDNGIISTLAEIDYEQGSHYLLLVTATDISPEPLVSQVKKTVTATVIVTILNENDNGPFFLNNKVNVSIAEDASVGTTVAQVRAVDRDTEDILQYTLASFNDNKFTIDPLQGIISLINNLDFEEVPSYLLTIVSTDGFLQSTAEVYVTVVNVNDESPVIHNPSHMFISIPTSQAHFIHCTDKDHLGPLQYDLQLGTTSKKEIIVNSVTGKLSFLTETISQYSGQLQCSDEIYKTSKNVTIYLTRKHSNVLKTSLSLSAQHPELKTLVTSSFLRTKFTFLTKNYVYFTKPCKEKSFHDDMNFFHIDQESGEVRSIKDFVALSKVYMFTMVAVPFHAHGPSLHVNISISYLHSVYCHPKFVGTPYSYKILYSVAEPRQLGALLVKYCSSYSVQYYLSSGHSYFTVNISSGLLFVHHIPPEGYYQYKVTAVILGTYKRFITTTFSVLTLKVNDDNVSCQYNPLRLFVNMTDKPGTKIGHVKMKNLPKRIEAIKFSVEGLYTFSVDNEGYVFVRESLLKRTGMMFDFEVSVTWSRFFTKHMLKCRTIIEVITSSNKCSLALTYGGPRLELYIHGQLDPGSFIFSIPVAVFNCLKKDLQTNFRLLDPNFKIDPKKGVITTKTFLMEGLFSFSVLISSSEAMNIIEIPVQIEALTKLNNVIISFKKNTVEFMISSEAPLGTSVGNISGEVEPQFFSSSLRYSLVSFCCSSPSNIAVYNGSIHQSYFQVLESTGEIFLQQPLSTSTTSFHLIIRASLILLTSHKHIFKDMEVNIHVKTPQCSCEQSYFKGEVTENSKEETLVVENILKWNVKDTVQVSLEPEYVSRLLRYDVKSNSLSTTSNPVDFETTEDLEVEIVVKNKDHDVIRCRGLIKVDDVNDNPPKFLRNYFMGYVLENALLNTQIVNVDINDKDSLKFPVTFSLSGDGSDNFNIDTQRGQVFTRKVLDREKKDLYDLKVRVSDGVHALETGIMITVLDVNDNAPFIAPGILNKSFVLNKSRVKAGHLTVATISATDADDPRSNNSKIFCEMSSSTTTVLLKKILLLNMSTCHLSLNHKYISLITENLTLTVEVLVKDKGDPPLMNSTILKICFIEERNELRLITEGVQGPRAVLLTTPKDTHLLTLKLSDQDKYEEISFVIIEGNGTLFFGVDHKTGKVSTINNLNKATIGTSYSLYLQVWGTNKVSGLRQSSNDMEMSFVICDFNLHSPEIRVEPGFITVSEDVEIWKKLAKVKIMDKDEGLPGSLEVRMDLDSMKTFALLPSGNDQVFDLVTSSNLDHETLACHNITLTVKDLGSPSRSQSVVFIVFVTDTDDNDPYFLQRFLIINLPSPQSQIQLPLAEDDDKAESLRSHKYSVSLPEVIKLQHLKTLLIAHISPHYWDRPFIHFSLSVTSTKSLSSSEYNNKLDLYLIIYTEKVQNLTCPPKDFEARDLRQGLQYHILTVHPKSSLDSVKINEDSGQILQKMSSVSKKVLFSMSRYSNNRVQYKVCEVFIKGHGENKLKSHVLILPEIKIKSVVEKGSIVGRIEVLNAGENVATRFFFNVFSNSFLPFMVINEGEIIVASRRINIHENIQYQVSVMARLKNITTLEEDLEGHFVIEVITEEDHLLTLGISLGIREMSGRGLIIGKIQEIVKKLEAFVLEVDGESKMELDREGILKVAGDLDREKNSEILLNISSEKTKVKLVIKILDENDNLSVARRTNVIIKVEGNVDKLGKVMRVIPLDNDIVGDYQCRLESLAVPRGVLLTPDCWLYITDPLSLSHQSHFFTVLHHDGIHNAVKSIFYIQIKVNHFKNKQSQWALVRLLPFHLKEILPRLRLLEVFLRFIKLVNFVIGLNPKERYIIVRANDSQDHALTAMLSLYKARIRAIMKVEGVEVESELCKRESCHFHGSCSSVLHSDYDNMFHDDDQLQRGRIHVYPFMEVIKGCTCDQGYVGLRCNVTESCPYQICHNGGSCGQDWSGQRVCECSKGFSGDRCDQDVNECHEADLCGPRGTCVNILGGYKCQCNLEWSGSQTCNRPFNHCLSNQCSSPGTIQCISIIAGFICQCAFGFYGDKCESSSLSFQSQSSLQWDLSFINSLSMEFATISQNGPLISVLLVSSVKVLIFIAINKVRLTLTNHDQILQYRQSMMEVSNGTWTKIQLLMENDQIMLNIISCGDLGDCEKTNTIYGGPKAAVETIKIISTFKLPLKIVTLTLGNDHSLRSKGHSFFIGCIRKLELHNVSVINKRETNVMYDSCPRFKDGVSPCGNAVEKCGFVGDCVDEWFHSRCNCPEGYQPPSCSPGHPAFSLAPNTIISFVQRIEFAARWKMRKKRQINDITSEISLKLKTSDVNSILLLSFSSLHTFTLIQINNGLIRIVDKFAGYSQEMTHKALLINDDKVHTLTMVRLSSGRLTVTVDSVVAIVEWLQSHDPLGPSVQTIYLAGVPQADRSEDLMEVPNYSGCLSEVRFNNQTLPFLGLTERFNVSLVQGKVMEGCSSEVCSRPHLCGKYQVCQEVAGVPHSHWGQYQCINNERSRLVAILSPILVCVVLSLALLTLLIYLVKRRARRLKAKPRPPSNKIRSKYNKKYPECVAGSPDNIDILNAGKDKPSRSDTTNTFLMQDLDGGDSAHPDLIRSHAVFGYQRRDYMPQCAESPYYQDTSLVNPYMSSGHLDNRISSAKLYPKTEYPKNFYHKTLSHSNNTLEGTQDSLVYRCSHPDEYEVMSSEQSLNSRETLGLTVSYQPPILQDQSHIKKGHRRINILSQGLSSSSSNTSKVKTMPAAPVKRHPRWDHYDPQDVFSNNESNLTSSIQVEESIDSLSSRDSGNNVFTPTNSSDSMASNKNTTIPKSSVVIGKFQWNLPPPPQSEDHYEYADPMNIMNPVNSMNSVNSMNPVNSMNFMNPRNPLT